MSIQSWRYSTFETQGNVNWAIWCKGKKHYYFLSKKWIIFYWLDVKAFGKSTSEKEERFRLSLEQILCPMAESKRSLYRHRETRDMHCRSQRTSFVQREALLMELTSTKRSGETMTDKGLLDLASGKVTMTFLDQWWKQKPDYYRLRSGRWEEWSCHVCACAQENYQRREQWRWNRRRFRKLDTECSIWAF